MHQLSPTFHHLYSLSTIFYFSEHFGTFTTFSTILTLFELLSIFLSGTIITLTLSLVVLERFNTFWYFSNIVPPLPTYHHCFHLCTTHLSTSLATFDPYWSAFPKFSPVLSAFGQFHRCFVTSNFQTIIHW